MRNMEKEKIIDQIMDLLVKLSESDDEEKPAEKTEKKPAEMLTIKECCEFVHGVSEHSIRQFITQGKIKSIRTGEGKRGKILVNKDDLLAFFGT